MSEIASIYPVWILCIFAAIAGLATGSFFNVLIHRMPLGQSLWWPPSKCPQCETPIRFRDNIPVMGWLRLKGKCYNCQKPIPVFYPLVEAITGITAFLLSIFFLVAFPENYPIGFAIFLSYWALTSIPVIIIDLRHYLIPDAITFPGMILGLLVSFIPGGMTPFESFSGLVIAGGGLWLFGYLAGVLLKKEAMGLGDVKLLAMAGAGLGWETALLGLMLAAIAGSIVGGGLLVTGKLDKGRHIPFGPYICLGIFFAAFFSNHILNWYMGVILPTSP